MSEKALATVQPQKFTFLDDELDVFVVGDGVLVSVRRVCDALGIDTAGQLVKLRSDEAISVDLISTQLPGDDQRREIACIDLRSLPLWLATIHGSKVREELRPKLLRYKREAAEVLANHFLGPRGALGIVRELSPGDEQRIDTLIQWSKAFAYRADIAEKADAQRFKKLEQADSFFVQDHATLAEDHEDLADEVRVLKEDVRHLAATMTQALGEVTRRLTEELARLDEHAAARAKLREAIKKGRGL